MVRLFALGLTALSLMGSVSGQAAEPAFGRYIGVLNQDRLGKQQIAKLEFVVARTTTNSLDLKAILTLHFGDFKSGEYTSFHFNQVRYHLLTGSLTFDDPDQALSIFVTKFKGGELVGDVTSLWGGNVGQLVLSQSQKVTPSKPLIESVMGEYAGTCGDYKAKAQVFTFRSNDDMGHHGEPFSNYSILANMQINCVDGQCINFPFTSGSYDYFAAQEQLSLVGPRMTLKCHVDGENLRCTTADVPSLVYNLTDCRFKRSSEAIREPRQMSPVSHPTAFQNQPSSEALAEAEFSALQSGEYRGYVFHEYLGRYQAADLNLKVFQAGSAGGARISAHARLFFGQHNSSESIPYRFAEIVYPNPIAGPQNVLLSRAETNLDAMLQITEAKNGVIKGIWYSILFGRVGPFEFRKDGLPVLPENAVKVERVTGVYRGSKSAMPEDPSSVWLIRLMVVPGIKPTATTENPFFPNLLRGWVSLWPLTGNLEISDGSYDFYTGRLAIIRAGKAPNGWVGSLISRKELQLTRMGYQTITPPPKYTPEIFRLEGGLE